VELEIPTDYPDAVREVLQALGRDLADAGGGVDLSALVVYGSVARREARPGSDVNLVVVIGDNDPIEVLARIRTAFRTAFRTGRVEPFVLQRAEISRLCDVFPAKLLDIQAHHDCIYGKDPFTSLEISWEDLRFRVEQGLRNQLLRMRRFYLFRGDDAQQLGDHLDTALPSVSVELEGLIRLAVGAAPTAGIADVLARAGALLDLQPGLIGGLAQHRNGQCERTADREQALYLDLMTLVTRAVEHVDQLEPPAPNAFVAGATP